MISPASVKDRIKKLSREQGTVFQDDLTKYCLERVMFRLSVSKYEKEFILKGGIFLYALFGGNYPRATKDIDFLVMDEKYNKEKIHEIFLEIIKIQSDDGLTFDIDSYSSKLITEFKDYPGVNISFYAFLDKTRIKISIDVGFSDTIYPEKLILDFPTVLNMDTINVYAYSIETVIAEKFESIVQLGNANSRFKDFFDIYELCLTHSFQGEILKQAIIETFENRETDFDDIVAFSKEFSLDERRNKQWNAAIRKKHAEKSPKFVDVLETIKRFLEPICNAIVSGKMFDRYWNYHDKKWE